MRSNSGQVPATTLRMIGGITSRQTLISDSAMGLRSYIYLMEDLHIGGFQKECCYIRGYYTV